MKRIQRFARRLVGPRHPASKSCVKAAEKLSSDAASVPAACCFRAASRASLHRTWAKRETPSQPCQLHAGSLLFVPAHQMQLIPDRERRTPGRYLSRRQSRPAPGWNSKQAPSLTRLLPCRSIRHWCSRSRRLRRKTDRTRPHQAGFQQSHAPGIRPIMRKATAERRGKRLRDTFVENSWTENPNSGGRIENSHAGCAEYSTALASSLKKAYRPARPPVSIHFTGFARRIDSESRERHCADIVRAVAHHGIGWSNGAKPVSGLRPAAWPAGSFFQVEDARAVGVFSATRMGVLDPATGVWVLCPRVSTTVSAKSFPRRQRCLTHY